MRAEENLRSFRCENHPCLTSSPAAQILKSIQLQAKLLEINSTIHLTSVCSKLNICFFFFCLLPVKRNAPNECSVWSVIRDDESVSVGITFFSGRRWPAWRQRQSADPSYLETWSWHPHPPNWMQLTWSYAKKQKTTLERGHDAAVNFSHFRYECIKIKSKLCQKSLCNLSELTSPSTPLLQKGNTVCQFSPS